MWILRSLIRQRSAAVTTRRRRQLLKQRYWYQIPNDSSIESAVIFSASYFVCDTLFDAANASSLFGFILHHLLVLGTYVTAFISGEYIQLVGYCLLLSEMANSMWISGFMFDYPSFVRALCRWWFFFWRLSWFLFVVTYVHISMIRGTCARWWLELSNKHDHDSHHRDWHLSDYIAFYSSLLLSVGTLGFAISFLSDQHAFVWRS